MVGGGVWGHHLSLLFSRLILVQCCQGCGVAATAAAILALTSNQFLPSPAPRMCTSGAAPGRGGRVGMVLFRPNSVTLAMVVRVILKVLGLFSCRVYVQSGTNE
jgi:hypothetical protein